MQRRSIQDKQYIDCQDVIWHLKKRKVWFQKEQQMIDFFRFGCFNHSRKLSDPCLDLFAKILENNPDSIIVLKSQTFIEKEERERIRQRFIVRGIHDNRLKILERCEDSQSHLMMYGEVDVALRPHTLRRRDHNSRSYMDGSASCLLSGKRNGRKA